MVDILIERLALGRLNLEKNSIWLITGCTVALCFMIAVVVLGEKPVVITKTEPNLTMKRFDPDKPPPDVSPTFHGVTKWKFECPCKVRYKVLEQFNDGNGSFVRIEIEGINADLALPMTMWMPDKPPEGLKAHEDGHVLICEKVYSEADKDASDIASVLIRKRFSGNGKNFEDACKFASGIAVVEFTREYEQRVAKKAQNVSEIYDYLTQLRKYQQKELVDQAFKVYEAGKPRSVVENDKISFKTNQ